MRYADPKLCPDCRSALPHGVSSCPTCGLLVRHRLAVELFRTLQRADDLVAELRSVAAAATAGTPAAPPLVPPGPAPAPVPAAPAPAATAPASAPAASGTATATLPRYPGTPVPPAPPVPPAGPRPPYGAPPPPPQRTGVAFASVPKILLGLGALCLLVAAVIFLAVSWSELGVGGRTAVLAAFTLGTGALALFLHRIGLRVAGESLIVVTLGLLGLDVIGAGSAGWLGDADGDGIAVVWGVVWAVAGTALGVLRMGDRPRLVAPQIVAGIGLFVAYLGGISVTDHDLLVGHLVVFVGGGAALLARRIDLPALLWSVLGSVGLAWVITVLVALAVALDDPDLDTLWVDGAGWSLLASSVAIVVPGMVLARRNLSVAGGSIAALLVTVALTIPSADTDARTVGLVALLVTLAWTVALALLPTWLRLVAVAPAVIGAALLAFLDLATFVFAAGRWAEIGDVFRHPFDVVLRGEATETEPLLTVPSVVLVVALVALLVPAGKDGRRPWPMWGAVAGVLGGLAAATTLASYDVPLAAVVAALSLTALGSLVAALRTTGQSQLAFGIVAHLVGLAATTVALPSEALTAAAAAVAFGAAMTLHLLPRDAATRIVGGAAVAPFLGIAVWAGAAAVGAEISWRGVPVLLAVGILALARARVEIEIPAMLVAVLTVPVAVVSADDAGGSLALHLTVAGCLVSATALLHESRRLAAWPGSALLLLATWVRLGDLGVEEPEPYTLPLAVAITVIGLWHLQRKPESSTAVALTPGLLLATVPSLLWVLDDPTSLRAVLLGIGAVAMTVAGALLRWSAPLVIGSVVGAIVVLRELGPYAGDAPVWVWIALGGALLVVVGITWERRLLELRSAVGMLGRLR